MKFVNRFFMILVALCLVCPGVSAVVNPKPFVIPELKEWKGAEGAFVPTETTKIVCPANQPELLRIARMLADDCETMFGHKPEVVQGKGGAGDVILAIRADKKLGKEGYTVKVTDRILLTAPESIGVYGEPVRCFRLRNRAKIISSRKVLCVTFRTTLCVAL